MPPQLAGEADVGHSEAERRMSLDCPLALLHDTFGGFA
jgi:hypothetical protein